MGRSKNIHIVQLEVEIEQPDNPEANWASGRIQSDAELSKELGRTIRNGNSFRLIGYGASLKGFTGSNDQDLGFAGVAAVQYCPVTKNSVGAWQSLQKQWMKQKQLSSAVGKYVRYDDFEVGWDNGQLLGTGRTSTILMSGLNDANAEYVGLYGTSVDGTYVSLEGYYDQLNPIPDVSKDPFGVTIKTAKFANKFPDHKTLLMPASFSSAHNGLGTAEFGGIATGEIQWLPADNHLSHLTGTLNYFFKGLPGDSAVVIADELKLVITLVYEGWAPLAETRSSKPVTRKQTSTAAKAKSTTSARRRS
ncbi:MAG: hypothetical protein [Circular genetic element sp.]|nr:MAG: hypothetical protein [Circular genetic element sp.]